MPDQSQNVETYPKLGRITLDAQRDPALRVDLWFGHDGDLVVWADGTARPLAGEALLVALGGEEPWWWLSAQGVQRLLDGNPGLDRVRLLHYLARPRGDRQVLVRAAFASLNSGAAAGAVADWLWWAFAFDPHPSVRRTFERQLDQSVWNDTLERVLNALLDLDPNSLRAYRWNAGWHRLPATVSARINHSQATMCEECSHRQRIRPTTR